MATVGLNPIFGDYINNYLSQGQALGGLDFAPYEGDRFAGPSGLQQQAFTNAGNLQAPDTSGASNLYSAGAGMIGTAAGAYNPSMVGGNPIMGQVQGGLGSLANTAAGAAAGYNPTMTATSDQMQGGLGALNSLSGMALQQGQNYTPGSFSGAGINAQQIGVGLDAGNWGDVQRYMSPYQQAVNDVTRRRMQEEFARQDMARKAAAVKAGAFGGSRFAIENSEAAKNQNQQVSDMDVQGMQRAYDAAQQSLAGQRGAQLQADTANQNASLQAAMESARQAMQAQQLSEQSRQFGAGLGMQGIMNAGNLTNQGMSQYLAATGQDNAAGLNKANLGLQGTNSAAGILGNLGNVTMGMTSADNAAMLNQANLGINAGNSLAGIGTSVANLGNNNFNQQLQALQAQAGLGAQQQKFEQDPLDFGYQQWQDSLKHPYQQVQFQQGLMSGLPLNYSGGQQENSWLAALQGGLGSYQLLQQLLGGK